MANVFKSKLELIVLTKTHICPLAKTNLFSWWSMSIGDPNKSQKDGSEFYKDNLFSFHITKKVFFTKNVEEICLILGNETPRPLWR